MGAGKLVPIIYMVYLIIGLIVGVNFAPFVFPKLDIWTAQGLWVQISTACILCYMLFDNRDKNKVTNISLSMLFGWLSFITFFRIYKSYANGLHKKMQLIFLKTEFQASNIVEYIQLFKIVQNVIYTLAPYLNFLCLLIIYLAITRYLTREDVKKVLCAMRWMIIVTLLTCVAQKFFIYKNVAAQFFKLIELPIIGFFDFNKYHNNLVIGFIANGTHLSGFLATCAPLFFWKTRRIDILSLILMAILLWSCSTTINDPSISGYIIYIVLFLFFYKTRFFIIPVFLLLCGLGYAAWRVLPTHFWSFQGRIAGWEEYWPVIQQQPLTGHGLGTLNIVSREAEYGSRHLHLEYYQAIVETGMFGLLFILNVIHEFFHTKAEDKEELVLKSMVLGFLLSCLFNYPAHLWLPSSWAMVSYSSFVALKGESYGPQSQRIKRYLTRYN